MVKIAYFDGLRVLLLFEDTESANLICTILSEGICSKSIIPAAFSI